MATFTVTTTATSGAGSLYRALLDAAENGVHTADTIVFGAGMSNETFHAGQTLTLSQDVTIDGDIGNDGNADVTISGGGSGGHRLFTITSGFTVTLDSLKLTYGHEAGADAGDDGSARGTAASVAVNCGTLTIANSLVLNNRAEGGKGVDKLDGGAGHDLADFSDMSKSVDLTLKGKKDATVKLGGAADNKVRNFESVTGGMAGDKLTGDKDSAEYVVFDTKLSAGHADIITDFKHGIDKIVLATSIFGKLGPSVEAVELVIGNGSKPLAAKQADDHLLYNKKTGQLFYDDDGKGKHAAVLVATFDKLPGGGLDHTDFLIV